MNKVKEAYKRVIVDFIIDNYVELQDKIDYSIRVIPENEMNEKKSALKYMRNLIKTITNESDEEIDAQIDEGTSRFYRKEE